LPHAVKVASERCPAIGDESTVSPEVRMTVILTHDDHCKAS